MGKLFSAVRHGVVVGVVAFGVFGAATAVFGQGARFHEDRPFFATTSGTSEVLGQQGTLIVSQGTGTIDGTHIGRGNYALAATQDYPRHQEAEHPANDCAFVGGTLTITAADGSTINGDLDADRSVSCVSEEFPGPGVDSAYLVTLYIHVEGGTGRFADATGWLFSQGTSRADTPPASLTFTDVGIVVGDIDY
ncbi:MAG TPA: hypothetical protein VEA19_00475 [Actinomycetota bacterium]|nr:hypothetical protein [Actinomycetota bacterium]